MTHTKPYIPSPSVLWRSFSFWTWAFFLFLGLRALPGLIVQYWYNQSLGFRTIFWTNLDMQLVLFAAYGSLIAVSVYLPFRLYARTQALRSVGLQVGVWIGFFGGWLLAGEYQQFLLALHGVPFGRVDSVFGKDIGFYVYLLPAWRLALVAVEVAIFLSLAACVVARFTQHASAGTARLRGLSTPAKIGAFAPPYANTLLYLQGITGSLGAYLSRYDLLVKANEPTGVRTGAAYVDLEGVFSTLNSIYLLTGVLLALTVAVGVSLSRLHRRYIEEAGGIASSSEGPRTHTPVPISLRIPVRAGAAVLALQICFSLGVIVRDYVFVHPNEPYVQKDYIKRHIQATLDAYRLDSVEVHEWAPPQEALSSGSLLTSRTVQNAPVVTPWVSYLEEPPDIQHYQRIAVSDSTMVFGPVLQTYQQQQQLRPYYKFLSVDGVRYTIDGRKQMFASAVRELPSLALIGHKEWLKYWGSAALLFTHGMGLVMSPVNKVDEVGNATYAAREVPPHVTNQALEHEPRVYFGEGAKDEYVLTNVRYLREFDYATEQAREEFTFPEGLTDGIRIDSLFKRLVFAAYTKDVTAFLFSRYIDQARTRVHIRRTPIARIRAIAPFLFLDTNNYAFIANKRVLWMVNGLTTSDQYPYSFPEILGDKADERAVEEFPQRVINYAEDSVKVTIDAYSGDVRFYKMSDDPVVSTWERIYPDLFRPASAMPHEVQAQLTYPLQWFHIQFDDIYKRYHQRDPIEFYNVEDLWDDADDTLGSIGRGLSGFGTGDQMTFSYEGYNVLLDPSDMPPGVDIGKPGDLQYAMLMPFTPESGRNLRSLIVALQDPGNYGRLLSLQIPQGMFVPGPEQIDAYIDNDRPVHQQVTMWIRHASEVIRGRTLLLPVAGDLMYVETIWVNSIQNELPQLKLVAVRYHDRITSGATLEAAIHRREAYEPGAGSGSGLLAKALEKGENRQGDGDSRSGHQQADSNKPAGADVHTVAVQNVQPKQAGQRSHRQQARP